MTIRYQSGAPQPEQRTLLKYGLATFDGTVTSGDDNDAWLMWAYLKDADNADNAVVGALTNYRIQDPADRNKFVKNLPSDTGGSPPAVSTRASFISSGACRWASTAEPGPA